MTWQNYVDTSMVATGHVSHGCLCSAAGDAIWAHSPDFKPSLSELKTIAEVVKGNEGAKAKAFSDGLFVNGVRYVVARADDRSIYARHGKDGVCIAKTDKMIIIGRHTENQQAGNATVTVEGLSDYLVKQGF